MSKAGNIYASNIASTAMMKAIISNEDLSFPGLEYSYFINKLNLLKIKIHGINNQTIGESGFVYVINNTQGFKNSPAYSWQYVSKEEKIPIAAIIPIQRKDFTYQIIDVTNKKIIQ
ncbi:hypothetical protein KO361_04255 [Candidatus Woesearchaeota archaeon]|jgi:hypothetical protein|nr:hypothetical protein [Candidatus Woesearchaeota archaeon]